MIETMLRVEPIAKDDPEAVAALEANRARNEFDPAVLGYPSSLMLKVSDETKVRGYMLTQSVQMLESMALNDRMTSEEKAEAAMNLMAFALKLAHQVGQREAYFMATDPLTQRAMERIGWIKQPWPVYRLKLDFVKESE